MLLSDSFSGAENVVCQIIHMFNNNDDTQFFYCSKTGPIKDALKIQNVNFVPLNNISVKEFKRAIKNIKPDVIHAHDMGASFYAALSCGKIPLISHIHNNNFNSRRISVKSLAYLIAAIKAKKIFWVSSGSYNGYVFSKFFKSKSQILYNVLNQEDLYKKMELDQNTYNYHAVYVGRLATEKNPQRLMEVFKKVTNTYKNAKFAVIGTGDLAEQTKKICQELNIENNVDFLGFKDNPLKILYSSKAMVLTSLSEGTPMCALEAMALGVPIVSTPVGGMNDLVTNGVNGYLFNNNDDLAAGIIDCILKEDIYKKLSLGAKETFSKINNTQEYKTAIKESYIKAVNKK